MGKLTKLYDTLFGGAAGAALTLLATGHHNGALVAALGLLALRLTMGRAALNQGGGGNG